MFSVEHNTLTHRGYIMTKDQFDHYLEVFCKSKYFTGCPFETANLIEKMFGDNIDNQILSRGLTEGWIEEAA
jgi:hypothetical protein